MISGKGFADQCRWIVDNRYSERPFRYHEARTGEWVFVNAIFLDLLVENIPRILSKKRFHFVLHNADPLFTSERLAILLPFALSIHSVNVYVEHPLVKKIPFGFSDSSLKVLPLIDRTPRERTIEIYSNFSIGTNYAVRLACVEAFAHDVRCVRKNPDNRDEYYRDLCNSKFVLCPEGNGVDTQRVYEALWCGATPVVLHSCLDDLYSKMPICIVTSWSDPFTQLEGHTEFRASQWLL